MTVYWNWKLARDGSIRFGLMLIIFSIISQNVLWLNSKFLSELPVGYFLLICFGIFIIRHIYRTLKWYSVWLKYGKKQKFENFLIHFCLYLIIVSVAFSIPNFNISSLAAAIATTAVEDKTTLSEPEQEPELSLIEFEESEIIEDSEPRITSSTLWVDHNTYLVGGDGHTITIKQNSDAKDPTYQVALDFLKTDQTDKCDYIFNKFVCADFAEQVQNNAEIAGYKCAYVCYFY